MNLKIIMLLLPFLLAIGFLSCTDDSETFMLGEDFVESQTRLALIDTFTVKMSTLLIDSVTTSGTDRMLVGSFSDQSFGKITTESYLQLGVPTACEADDITEDVYDSLFIVLVRDSYNFGDTDREFTLHVHQLAENITLNDHDELLSSDSFAAIPKSLGSVTFRPGDMKDSLMILLDDTFGKELFTSMKNNEELFADTDQFLDYFPGLVFIADESSSGVIISFEASTAKMVLKTERPGLENQTIDYWFSIYESEKQFNHITHDFSATDLVSLTTQSKALPDDSTGQLIFSQGGIGLAIKIEFPTLNNLLLLERGIIKKVLLSMKPLPGSYEHFELPSSLLIYESGPSNSVLEKNGEVAFSDLTIDDIYNDTTCYTFDLSAYFQSDLQDSFIDPEKELIILPAGMASNFSRLIVDSRQSVLNIYYLSY